MPPIFQLIVCVLIFIFIPWLTNFDLAGGSDARTPTDPNQPYTFKDISIELEKKFGNTIPEAIFRQIKLAVDHHFNKRYEKAFQYYRELTMIPDTNGGSFDLIEKSPKLKHNMTLTQAKLAHKP